MASKSNWMITINEDYINYSPDEMLKFFQNLASFRYCCFQVEEAPTTGTIHYQCYVQFTHGKTLSWWVNQLGPSITYIAANGTPDQCNAYVTKEESRVMGPFTAGVMSQQGQRTDLEQAISTLEDKGMYQTAKEHPVVYIKYHKGLEAYRDLMYKAVAVEEPVWRLWQQEALYKLTLPVDDRKIHWYVDVGGATGKSFLVNYLARNKQALTLSNGRHDRLQYQWEQWDKNRDQSQSAIVTFDFAREVAEATPYGVIEKIKDAATSSGFYGAGPYRARGNAKPYVYVFSNFMPDESKLSADRWDIVIIEQQ